MYTYTYTHIDVYTQYMRVYIFIERERDSHSLSLSLTLSLPLARIFCEPMLRMSSKLDERVGARQTAHPPPRQMHDLY